MILTVEQIALSTAEEERNHFTGISSGSSSVRVSTGSLAAMPFGTYRVVNGELFRILPGSIPGLPVPTEHRS